MPIPPESLIKGTADVSEHRLSDHVARLIKEASPLNEMFPVNSYVLLKPPDGAREKLQMPKAGPYIVVGISRDKYSIQDLLTHKITDTHVSNLCEFRGKTQRHSNMGFLVSWVTQQRITLGNRTRRFAKPKHS